MKRRESCGWERELRERKDSEREEEEETAEEEEEEKGAMAKIY